MYVFKRNIIVDMLNFYDNGIIDIGIRVFVDLLEENCFIISFDIFGNNIGIDGNCVME